LLFTRIVGGGQTGVDRAALDLALELGIDVGGWVPKGRLTEESEPLPAKYINMMETPSTNYETRTEWNVRDSDTTLLICSGELKGGSDLTLKFAIKLGRPYLYVNLAELSIPECIDKILTWLSEGHYEVLNIAGPRLSEDKEIYDKACLILRPVFIASR
jgi:Circularly permutated YpsA SLOG family